MSQRKLQELVVTTDPGIDLLQQLVRDAEVPCELLPPGPEREKALLYLQVTTRSMLGAFAYDTGGLLIDDGWLRLLGSGHPNSHARFTNGTHRELTARFISSATTLPEVSLL